MMHFKNPIREEDTLEHKDTNPKDSVGIRKVPLRSVIPLRVLSGLALAMLEGARKYGRHNYRVAGVRASVYVDAAGRHLDAFWEGQDIDPDSLIHHLDKCMASIAVLRDSIYAQNWVDDRPPKCDPSWITFANELASSIIDRVRPKDPERPYTETDKAPRQRVVTPEDVKVMFTYQEFPIEMSFAPPPTRVEVTPGTHQLETTAAKALKLTSDPLIFGSKYDVFGHNEECLGTLEYAGQDSDGYDIFERANGSRLYYFAEAPHCHLVKRWELLS
jgi:hypothetical protein